MSTIECQSPKGSVLHSLTKSGYKTASTVQTQKVSELHLQSEFVFA